MRAMGQIGGILVGTLREPTYPKYRFRWQLILHILEKYRMKRSLLFLIYHGLFQARKITLLPEIQRTYQFLTGRKEQDMRQLLALYYALEKERGPFVAACCATELAQAVILWEKEKQK